MFMAYRGGAMWPRRSVVHTILLRLSGKKRWWGADRYVWPDINFVDTLSKMEVWRGHVVCVGHQSLRLLPLCWAVSQPPLLQMRWYCAASVIGTDWRRQTTKVAIFSTMRFGGGLPAHLLLLLMLLLLLPPLMGAGRGGGKRDTNDPYWRRPMPACDLCCGWSATLPPQV